MFKHLTNIYLPQVECIGTVVHIGAGKCSEQVALKALAPEKIVLVEADQKKVNRLKRIEFWQSDVNIINRLIVPRTDIINASGNADFYHANNYKYSSFCNSIEPLRKLLPNIDATVKSLSAQSINKLLLDIDISEDKKNILLIDISDPNNLLIEALASDILQKFSLVGILFTGLEEQEEKLAKLTNIFNEKGFELAFADLEQDIFNYLYFKRPLISLSKLNEIEQEVQLKQLKQKELSAELTDKAKSLKAAIESNEQLEKKYLESRNECNKLKSEHVKASQISKDITKQLENLKVQKQNLDDDKTLLEKKLIEQKELTSEQKKWHDTYKGRLAEANALLDKTKAEMANSENSNKNQQQEQQIKIDFLEEKIIEKQKFIDDTLASSSSVNTAMVEAIVAKISDNHQKELMELKKKLDWRIDKGFNNSIKQIESFIGIQSFLENGALTMDFHGWPISSDIALFLLGQINKNNYDLIIEFGSGTSTKLFAKAITNNRLKDVDNAKSYLLTTSNVPESEPPFVEAQDLPKRVLTFEHNKKYFDKTKTELEQIGFADVVNLVHAPLIDCAIGEESFLYYDCDKSLARIADIYEGRIAKVLVLVDGPPGSTGPMARLPAMIKLLNHLGNHQLDIVLDDYNRQEEKDIVEKWKQILNSRFINFEEELVPCEKGAFVCHINP